MKAKGKNPWLEHLSKTKKMKQNKGKTLKECMKVAKATYKKK